MSNWSEGYVDNVVYTYGYYKNIQPEALTIPFLMKGLIPPTVINACELGFGQGVSFNIHSAAGSANWYGTDFNPSHARFAQYLASSFESGALIADQSFQAFCQRDDLPDFDFIALHGIWSWISDENRHIIVDFIRRKLKVGGVLSISYNTLPGWSGKSPIRHLLSTFHQTTATSSKSHEDNVKETLRLSEQTLKLSQLLTKETPSLLTKIEDLKNTNINYLAHEYLNKDWQPMYFTEMEQWLEGAKVKFACSTNFLDDFYPVSFNQEQINFISQFSHASQIETMKDFMLNKQFRSDFWVKGNVSFEPSARRNAWHQLRVLFITPRKDFSLDISRHISISLNASIANPILDILEDGQIHQVGNICQQLNQHEVIFEVLAILYAHGHLLLIQDDKKAQTALPRCQAFNQAIMALAKDGHKIEYLASPMTGGAITVPRFEQLFLSAYQEGIPQEQWGAYVWNTLKERGQQLIHEGRTLETDQEHLNVFNQQAKTFIENKFNLLKKLKIVI
ncbi:class I SAM-dependent methyltransferase [Pelistega ratti]|uniref:class I SAM-dependent methyltransferase n=1 Tax=Pelistega ratti TaxID=2652177 RepID=UPI00135A267D|nr:class I SAM-dependent methyltransferase [Pelistega ratti]